MSTWDLVSENATEKILLLGQTFDTSQKHVWCELGLLILKKVLLSYVSVRGKGSFSDFMVDLNVLE